MTSVNRQCMQYDTIEELTLELALYPNKKIDILEDYAKYCRYGWFTVAKDGNCALFDKTGELDDLSKVKSIDESMISRDIEKIIIPDAVTVIYDYSFYCRTKLTDVMIPDKVTNIGYSVFRGCSGLTDITIPDSVTNIMDFVFYDCSRLMNVTIPNSVTSIGSYAFTSCIALTSMIIPESITNIEQYAFFNCPNLKELVFKGKTLEEVQSMENFPFGIADESIISCEG